MWGMAKISPFRALRFKNFLLFWSGSFVSQLGDQMQIVAIAWQVYLLTRSVGSLGLIGLSGFVPILLFSLLGGLVADRVDRKNLLITCQVLLAAITTVLYLETHFNLISPWMIYLVLALSATVNSFSMPARQSIIPNLVPKNIFMNAVSLNTIQRQTAIVIGPAIAGFLIALSGPESVYLFNSISFIILVFALFPVRVPPHNKSERVSFELSSITEGIRFVKNSPIISSTMILDFLATFFGTANILMPVFAKDILNVGARGLGFLYAAPAVGGVLAGFYFANRHHIKHQGKIIIGSIIVYGLAIIGFGLSRYFYLSLFLLALMGMGDMISTIIRNTLRQLLTPDHIRGRMISINMLFVQGGPKMGDTEAGFLAATIGAPLSVVVGGAATILITLWIAKTTPNLRNYSGDLEIETI